ncbi:MAG: hypothetical protein LUH45_06785 [Clostridiales bacterium]|nr:hypothetical protein [Clostridiales bacterium]
MTDNITPQTRAPMTTKEVIDRLKQVSFTYSRLTADGFSSKEVARDKQALTAAAQAVELLEEIKAELRGECSGCKSAKQKTYEPPCCDCLIGEGDDKWEFRWPLGKAGHDEKETNP